MASPELTDSDQGEGTMAEETWEYAELIWDGEEIGDRREVWFSNSTRDPVVPTTEEYFPTLHWLGQLGFEMVGFQFFPLSHYVEPRGANVMGLPTHATIYPTNRGIMWFKRRSDPDV
jgi:hypothetical protein